MERSRRQPLLAADDVADFHQVVVHNVGQVIGGQFVGTLEEHLVVKYVALDDNLAADDVEHMDVLARLHQEADHILLSVLYQLVHLGLGQRERVAHLQAR